METLKALGQIAGVGGIALGVFFLLYRDVIRKNIFSRMPPAESYKLMRLIIIAVWSVAIIGMLVWVSTGMQITFGSRSPIING